MNVYKLSDKNAYDVKLSWYLLDQLKGFFKNFIYIEK